MGYGSLLLCLCVAFVFACRPQDANQTATSRIQVNGPRAPDTCPVTRPSTTPFLLSPPYSASRWLDPRMFSYGSDQLWVDLPKIGVWPGLHLNYARTPPAYTQPVVWWQKGYDRHREPHPDLQITGRRLDAPAQQLMAGRAEGDRARTVPDRTVPDSPDFIAVRIDLPTLGCWEVTGKYMSQTLTFVVWATDKE